VRGVKGTTNCKPNWNIEYIYGVWSKFGFGVMRVATCKKCKRSEYVSFVVDDPEVDMVGWANPNFKTDSHANGDVPPQVKEKE